jgi:hypothetical protein
MPSIAQRKRIFSGGCSVVARPELESRSGERQHRFGQPQSHPASLAADQLRLVRSQIALGLVLLLVSRRVLFIEPPIREAHSVFQ